MLASSVSGVLPGLGGLGEDGGSLRSGVGLGGMKTN